MAGDLHAMPPEREMVSAAGRRAVEFIRWAIDTFGATGEPERIVVHRSQAELTLAWEGVGTPSTIAWYVAQLREAGIVVGTRPIVVDLAALEQTESTAAGAPERTGPQHEARRDDTGLTSLLARQAEQIGRAMQLLAEMAATQAAVAQALAATGDSRIRESNPVKFAEKRESRESKFADMERKEGKEGNFSNLPSFLDADTRGFEFADSREPIGLEEVDEIVEPLRAWCRQAGRSDRLDVNGRRILAPLGRRALEAGVAAIQREAAGDPAITRPVGLLVARARRGDPDTFTPPPEPPPPPGPSPWLPPDIQEPPPETVKSILETTRQHLHRPAKAGDDT